MIDAAVLLQILFSAALSAVAAGVGAWGAIKFALGRMEARQNHTHEIATLGHASAAKAHERIDEFLLSRKTGN